MTRLHFETVTFREESDTITATLYGLFEVVLPRTSFEGKVCGEGHTLIWDGVAETEGKSHFEKIFNAYLPQLCNKLTKNPAIFIHRNSGIPLLGSLAFGLVDRGTNMLEVKPITGCNINCTFCSVDEGDDTKKGRDYVVEREYLVQEVIHMLNEKGEVMDIWINTQGEPTLYAELAGLISDIKKIHLVNKIALITNGTMLSPSFLDTIQQAGLHQLDVSINAINETKAVELAGTKRYNGAHIREMVAYAVQLGLDVVIAPVYLKGNNEKDIEDIIRFAQEIGCKKVYVQNFLSYQLGRNSVKPASWKQFELFLNDLQTKYPAVDLFAKDHTIKQTKPLPKPFRSGDHVKARIVAAGRYPKELLAAAQGRCITIPNGKSCIGKEILIEITRDKDNIYYGKEIKK